MNKRRAAAPDIEKGIYPFKGMKLSRADVEWLLATHENGRGPVDWNDPGQRGRRGLDLRGADLNHENLSGLPLTRLNAGLETHGKLVTEEQTNTAAMRMENVNLERAQLQRANFFEAQLQRAYLKGAQLQGADLSWTQLEQTNLSETQLQCTNFFEADLPKTYLYQAQLQGSQLNRVKLEDAFLDEVNLCDEKYGPAYLADIDWGTANLAVVDWTLVKMLGEEQQAYKTKSIDDCQTAVRANRQLAVVLQAQGLNEDAARFAYRAQVLQKRVLWLQMLQKGVKLRQRMRALGAWLFSWFLFLFAGYGYRPGRSFLAYLLVISGFATTYYFLGHMVGPVLTPLGAFVFSMTSFHGRGFFPGNNISLDDPLTVLAAFEALVGLIIEVTFIATLTRRLFGQ